MTARPRARDVLLTGLFLAALLPAQAVLAETRSFQKSFPAAAATVLVVRSDVGEIRVTGGATEVSVQATIDGSRAEVERFEIEAVERNGRIEDSGSLQVTYVIQVPDNVRLELNTAGSNVLVRRVAGEVTAKTSGGNIGFRDVGGSATASTSGGHIHIERVAGSIHARTSGGDILLSGATSGVEARTSGGDVSVDHVQGEVVARTSGGDITVGLEGEHKGIDVQTSGGSIELRLATTARADVDASTSGGSVRVNLPVTQEFDLDDNEFRGRINGGGPPIRARTSGGSIRISAAD
jgi:hypothetical protein